MRFLTAPTIAAAVFGFVHAASAAEQTIVTTCTTEQIGNRTIERCEVSMPSFEDEIERQAKEYERLIKEMADAQSQAPASTPPSAPAPKPATESTPETEEFSALLRSVEELDGMSIDELCASMRAKGLNPSSCF